jgi:protein ImuA
MPARTRHETLAALRAQLAPPPTDRAAVGLDGFVSRTGNIHEISLITGEVHEILPGGPGEAGAIGFATALLANRMGADPRPALWANSRTAQREIGRPYAPGLAQAGIDPARLMLVTTRNDKDLLWALEEALRSAAFAAIAALAGDVPFTPSRRLSLAAASSGTALFLLRPAGTTEASAASTRWRITQRPGLPNPFDARTLGRSAWQIERLRARNGPPQIWEVRQDDTQDPLDLAARSGHRAVDQTRRAAG